MYFITPSDAKVAQVLEAWSWLDIAGMRPFRVTAFGSIFLEAEDGVWFLDTLAGSIEPVCAGREELDDLLSTDEAQGMFLLAGFVERANAEGLRLGADQCYDFRINPVLGGPMTFENLQVTDFAVAGHIAGQIHEQVRQLPVETEISGVTIDGDQPQKPPTDKKSWWKFW